MSTQESSERTMNGSSFLMVAGVGALAVIALLVSTVAFGFAVFGTESDAAVGAAGGGGTTTVDVMLMEFAVTPAVIEVPAGDTLVLNVTNDGAMVHDLKLNGETGTAMLDPGSLGDDRPRRDGGRR
jgi:nitrite reductase (NO-forming)